MLLLSFLLFFIGVIVLIKGADFLVEGASSVAFRLNIAPIVIGLTVVAFGTSAPELVVSVTSAFAGNTDIALGNVIGSNIANILLILGICGIITSLTVNRNTVWKEIPMSLLGALVLTILGLQDVIDGNRWGNILESNSQIIGHISFSNGLILLFFFVIFLYYTFGIAKVTGDDSPDIKSLPMKKSLIFIIGGLFALVVGSKLTVDNAVILARTIGVSDKLIGLTLVAVGTSLPEISTSVIGALKNKVDLAIGNVVGSNIFNIFLILGITSLIKPLPLRSDMLFDIIMLFIATGMLFLSLFVARKFRIERREGIVMVGAYIIYLCIVILRG